MADVVNVAVETSRSPFTLRVTTPEELAPVATLAIFTVAALIVTASPALSPSVVFPFEERLPLTDALPATVKLPVEEASTLLFGTHVLVAASQRSVWSFAVPGLVVEAITRFGAL